MLAENGRSVAQETHMRRIALCVKPEERLASIFYLRMSGGIVSQEQTQDQELQKVALRRQLRLFLQGLFSHAWVPKLVLLLLENGFVNLWV